MDYSSTLKKVAVGLALTGLIGSATAGTHDLGTLDHTLTWNSGYFSGSFDDVFSFKSGPLPGVLGKLSGLDMFGNLSTEFRVGTWSGNSVSWGNWGSVVSPGTTYRVISIKESFLGLTPGTTYWFELKGAATRANYSVTLAPVPEPETYAMFLAGLGLVGAVARRRRNVVAA